MKFFKQPDNKSGNYYVSVIRANGHKPEFRLLLGPFRDNHQAALDRVAAVRDKAQALDPKATWYAFGTARTEPEHDAPGSLNDELPELLEAS